MVSVFARVAIQVERVKNRVFYHPQEFSRLRAGYIRRIFHRYSTDLEGKLQKYQFLIHFRPFLFSFLFFLCVLFSSALVCTSYGNFLHLSSCADSVRTLCYPAELTKGCELLSIPPHIRIRMNSALDRENDSHRLHTVSICEQ